MVREEETENLTISIMSVNLKGQWFKSEIHAADADALDTLPARLQQFELRREPEYRLISRKPRNCSMFRYISSGSKAGQYATHS